MKILAIGDIVGESGREFIYNNLFKVRKKYDIDFVIANGENAANTNGITRDIANMLVERGVDVITMGNHTFSNRECPSVLESNPYIIRPLNLAGDIEGVGSIVADTPFGKVGVINLLGRVNMSPADCPFRAVEKAIKEMDADIIAVDMHAEATSEKLAMGNFIDSMQDDPRPKIVFGTHTHVQTADEHIMPYGVGYISDLGMTGVMDSVLGVKKEIIIQFYYNMGKRYKFEKADGVAWLNGCVFDIDVSAKKVVGLERLRFNKI